MVVDTHKWLPGKHVLISPYAIQQLDFERRRINLQLNKWQVELAPHVDLAKPVSRQLEERLAKHYRWPVYWEAVIGVGAPVAGYSVVRRRWDRHAEENDDRPKGDPHLRSFDEIKGYGIKARDEGIGEVVDFIVDFDNWSIIYAVIDTRRWLPGRKVLIPVLWCNRFDWERREFYVDLSRDQVKASPTYEPGQVIDRDYEMQLFDHYVKPHYWD
jgi:hypothetical protein